MAIFETRAGERYDMAGQAACGCGNRGARLIRVEIVDGGTPAAVYRCGLCGEEPRAPLTLAASGMVPF